MPAGCGENAWLLRSSRGDPVAAHALLERPLDSAVGVLAGNLEEPPEERDEEPEDPDRQIDDRPEDAGGKLARRQDQVVRKHRLRNLGGVHLPARTHDDRILRLATRKQHHLEDVGRDQKGKLGAGAQTPLDGGLHVSRHIRETGNIHAELLVARDEERGLQLRVLFADTLHDGLLGAPHHVAIGAAAAGAAAISHQDVGDAGDFRAGCDP